MSWRSGRGGCLEAHQSGVDLEVYLDPSDEVFFASEAADDRWPDSRGVTREMWEAERSRLAGPVWSGEGFPKAGELVDAPVNGARYMCEVLAVEGNDIAVRIPGAVRVVDISEIKPVRTQEQIGPNGNDGTHYWQLNRGAPPPLSRGPRVMVEFSNGDRATGEVQMCDWSLDASDCGDVVMLVIFEGKK